MLGPGEPEGELDGVFFRCGGEDGRRFCQKDHRLDNNNYFIIHFSIMVALPIVQCFKTFIPKHTDS